MKFFLSNDMKKLIQYVQQYPNTELNHWAAISVPGASGSGSFFSLDRQVAGYHPALAYNIANPSWLVVVALGHFGLAEALGCLALQHRKPMTRMAIYYKIAERDGIVVQNDVESFPQDDKDLEALLDLTWNYQVTDEVVDVTNLVERRLDEVMAILAPEAR